MACSNFWKLDKIDKIFISLVCIIVALYSSLQCFASETEELDFTKLSNYTVVQSSPDSGYLSEASSEFFIAYVELEPGYLYTFTADATNRRTGFATSISDGVQLSSYSNVASGQSISFTPGFSGKFFVSSTGSAMPGTITRVKLNGLEGTVDILVSDVGPGALWGIFETALPYVLVVVTLALGFYFIRRMTKWISRGRGNL